MNQINTISDLMDALQNDTEAIKAGTLDEKTGRVVLSGRGIRYLRPVALIRNRQR